MNIRVITLHYSEGIQGFSEEVPWKVCLRRLRFPLGHWEFRKRWANPPEESVTMVK